MIRRLKVGFMFDPGEVVPVGEMLRSDNGNIYFQFDAGMLRGPLSPSPFKLQMIPEPQTPRPNEANVFEGLYGVFADSLPDGWGLIMMSRAMGRSGRQFSSTSALDRLSYIGNRAMGALIYEPDTSTPDSLEETIELTRIANEVNRFFKGDAEDILPELTTLGGSPGGARPKILVGLGTSLENAKHSRLLTGIDHLPSDYEHWIIKFRSKDETPDATLIESIYAKTAHHVGVEMTESRLIEDRDGRFWFATKRFDRGPSNSRIHVHSVAGIAHANFRLPSLDYDDLLKITSAVTKRQDDLLTVFRLAAFNIIFHNRDDHAKNFSFIMSKQGTWRFAPAYDLTYSAGPGGEHTTSVSGEGRAPTRAHLLKLADSKGIKKEMAAAIIDEVESGISFMKDLLRQYKVVHSEIQKRLDQWGNQRKAN